MNVDKAILLLKQWGTPVWMSALAGAKFVAVSKILIAALFIISSAWTVKILFNRFGLESDKDRDKDDLKNKDVRLIVLIVAIIVVGFCISFAVDGIYELVSLDYQAYKMMLLK